MKKSYSTVLALLIAATVGMHTTTAQAGIFDKPLNIIRNAKNAVFLAIYKKYHTRSAQAALNLVEKDPSALETIHQHIFDTVIKELTDNNAGTDFIDDSRTIDIMATMIKKHDYVLQKLLTLLATPKIVRENCYYKPPYSRKVVKTRPYEIIRLIFTKLLNDKQLIATTATTVQKALFDAIMEQFTNNTAETCYIDYQYIDHRTPDIMVKIIKKNNYALQKFLAFLTSKNMRTDSFQEQCSWLVVDIIAQLLGDKKLAPTYREIKGKSGIEEIVELVPSLFDAIFATIWRGWYTPNRTSKRTILRFDPLEEFSKKLKLSPKEIIDTIIIRIKNKK